MRGEGERDKEKIDAPTGAARVTEGKMLDTNL